MSYIPPDGNDANFDLIVYIAPAGNEANFNLTGTEASTRDSEVIGKEAVNSERDSEITGTGTPSERDSEIFGKQAIGDQRDSEVIGKAFLKIPRNYRIIVRDETDTVIGEIKTYRNLKFGKRLNNYGTASFDIPVSDLDDNSLISLRRYSVWIYYQKDANTTLVWSGEQAAREGNLTSDGNNWSTIYCYDWLEQLNARYTGAEVTFSGIDAGQIAMDLIDETQSQTNGDFGITEGTIEATVNRDRTYYNDNIMEKIIQLSNVISGFDFEITNNRVFNVYSVMGVDRTDEIILEYGVNIVEAKVFEDFTEPVNRGIVIGQSTDDLANLIRVERDDAGLQATYKVREGLLSEMDVSETDTMEEKGDALRRKYGQALLKVDMKMASVLEPNITQFGLGDGITLVIQSGIYNISGQYRVFEWEVTFNDNNQENLSLVLGNFTYE